MINSYIVHGISNVQGGQLFNGKMHIALYCYIVYHIYWPTCHQTFAGQLKIQYHMSLWNVPTYVCPFQIDVSMTFCIF